MTDALARQSIQRWTGQLVPPDTWARRIRAVLAPDRPVHADVAACATALSAHFGIEWDITEASPEELAELGEWIELYKRHRRLIHSGRVVRLDTPDDTAWMTASSPLTVPPP